MTDPRTLHILGRCGFNHTEALVVADLMARGESTAGTIATRCSLKRATVYSALAQLEGRGLLDRRRSSSVNRFSLVGYSRLLETLRFEINAKREAVQDATRALEDVMIEYPQTKSRHVGGYEISSYESRLKTEEFFLRTLKDGHYDSLYDIATFSKGRWRKLMLELLSHTAKTRPPMREIIVASSDPAWYVNQIRNPLHQVKVVASRGAINTDFTITRDAVILNSYDSGAEISLQIKHQGYRETMSRIFEALWTEADSF
jgi:sugar-specific transcriptional regulator TrmB